MVDRRRQAVIVDVVRTPSGRASSDGSFADVNAAELLATALLGVTDRADISSGLIEDVIAGCVRQVGEQSSNIARTAALAAGFSETVPGITINRHAASGQQALQFAVQGVESGANEAVIACGVESMSRVHTGLTHDATTVSRVLRHRYPELLVNQAVAAELVCARWDLSRVELDEYSIRSHERAARASAEGLFSREIVPVGVPVGDGQVLFSRFDETIRTETNPAAFAAMKPAFHSAEDARRFPDLEWMITRGNSCQRADGAAAALVMSAECADRLGLVPRAVLRSSAVIGSDALLTTAGVVPATKVALDRANLSISDMDAVEIDETFAAIPLAWNREFGIADDRVNAWGGAISLGNPLGAVGVRMLATMLSRLDENGGRFGLQVTAAAGGMANATVVERLTTA